MKLSMKVSVWEILSLVLNCRSGRGLLRASDRSGMDGPCPLCGRSYEREGEEGGQPPRSSQLKTGPPAREGVASSEMDLPHENDAWRRRRCVVPTGKPSRERRIDGSESSDQSALSGVVKKSSGWVGGSELQATACAEYVRCRGHVFPRKRWRD